MIQLKYFILQIHRLAILFHWSYFFFIVLTILICQGELSSVLAMELDSNSEDETDCLEPPSKKLIVDGDEEDIFLATLGELGLAQVGPRDEYLELFNLINSLYELRDKVEAGEAEENKLEILSAGERTIAVFTNLAEIDAKLEELSELQDSLE